MGYHTDFMGRFKLNKTMEQSHAEYIRKFCETRRMKRTASAVEKMEDTVRKAVKLPVGTEGGYFVGGGGFAGQDHDKSIVDYNCPPKGQPGLWCHWTVSEDGNFIEWDGGEKFYDYVEWLNYVIDNFLAPWGYVLNGQVEWQGEDHGDIGLIEVKKNKVVARGGRIVYD